MLPHRADCAGAGQTGQCFDNTKSRDTASGEVVSARREIEVIPRRPRLFYCE